MGTGTKLPYPMWTVICDRCGFVCTIWEKPGTGCSYIQYCPECGSDSVETEQVDDKEEHTKSVMQ